MRLPLLAAALLAAPIAAQTAPPPEPAGNRGRDVQLGRQGPTIVAEPIALMLAGCDADQDGLVARAEAAACADRSFTAIARDAADIGFIGYSQWAARWLGDANAAPGPYEVDTDRDSRIGRAEVAGAVLGAFARFDTNRDGTLTRAELVTVRATVFGDDGRRRGQKPRQ